MCQVRGNRHCRKMHHDWLSEFQHRQRYDRKPRFKDVLRELARCLVIFPNVHTLRLDYSRLTVPYNLDIMSAFSYSTPLPQLRSIIIPQDCNALLRCYPGKRNVHIIGSKQALSKDNALFLATYCPKMENIVWVSPYRWVVSEPFIPCTVNVNIWKLPITYSLT